MKIAIAATSADINAMVDMHAARAACYLLFDDQGELLEVLANPYSEVTRGAAPKVTQLLVENGVALLAAGEFGPKFEAELEMNNIRHIQKSGVVVDLIREIVG